MTEWLQSIILGLVEGITEFIPVSSTAHLLISDALMELPKESVLKSDLFNIVIQGGAVLAVIPLFWKKFTGMIFGLREPANRELLTKLIVGFIITSAGMLFAEKKGFKLPEELAPVGWALLIGGVVILIVEAMSKRRRLTDDASWVTVIVAFGIGQIIAGILTGSSRSGTTIMLAMLLGMSRPAATEFTFLLGVPTLVAASGWKLLKALKGGGLHADGAILLAIGFVVAAISSFIVVKWLIRYVQHHTFNGFAAYRIFVGALIFAALAAGWVKSVPSEKHHKEPAAKVATP